MVIQRLADGFRKTLPKNVFLLLRQCYFTIFFLLGPRLATWRQRRATRNPVTHLEKVRHKMAYDRSPVLTILCDKIRVRDLVAQLAGEKYLTETFYLGYDVNEINWESLPREFACKVNHGAGGVILVREGADPSVTLPSSTENLGWVHLEIHPDNVQVELMEKILRYWLSLDYSWKKSTLLPEWAYKDIKRGVIIEELLSIDGEIPNDYKFYVVNGEVKVIREQTKRYSNSRGLYEYDREWNLLGTSSWDNTWKRHPGSPPEIPNLNMTSPKIASELVRVAEVIGTATDAMRVDLYAIGDRVVFGETTVYPNAGNDFFTQDWLAKEIGKDWHPIY